MHLFLPSIRSLYCFVLLVLPLVVVSLATAQEPKLTGTWECSDSESKLTLKLNADGTGTLNADSFRYIIRADQLIVEDSSGGIRAYSFRLTGETLTVSGGNLPHPVTFTRPPGATGIFEKNLSAAPSSRTTNSGEKREGGLVGRWESSIATVEILDDGTLTINGERFRYKAEGDVINLSNSEGSARVQFQLQGDTLITNYNGERTVYSRSKGKNALTRGGNNANASDLAGKWCYMSNVTASDGGRMSNTCFTLYENGTYDYYSETSSSGPNGGSASQESDSGTWRVAGSTLTANSRARGTLTFTLEKRNHPKTGDPMLVLDGDAFVTYSPRQPWP